MVSDPQQRPSAEELCRSSLVRSNSIPLKTLSTNLPLTLGGSQNAAPVPQTSC